MTVSIVEVVDLAVTTDASGSFTYTFPSSITQVVATANGPQTGASTAVVSVVAQQTGDATVTCRVWLSNVSNGRLVAAVSQQVNVTLVGYHQ